MNNYPVVNADRELGVVVDDVYGLIINALRRVA